MFSRLVLMKQLHAYAFVLPLPQPATAKSSIRRFQPSPHRLLGPLIISQCAQIRQPLSCSRSCSRSCILEHGLDEV
jgi:hypothetical protein